MQTDSSIKNYIPDYKRDLGLKESISIIISRIIGSGIFRTPAPIMALVGCTSLFSLVWILGGLITIFSAIIYSELTAMMPKSGGPYVFLKEAYGPYIAFLRGWAMFFVSETASIVAVALVFSEYLNAIHTIIRGYPFGLLTTALISLITIWVLTLVNMRGVAFSGRIQIFMGIIKIVAVGAIIGITIAGSSTGNMINFQENFWPESFDWSSFLAIGAALRYSFFTFSGWEGATYIAEEVKNPSRNLPLSLFFGISGIIVLYLGANWGYLYQLGPQGVSENKWVATAAVQNVLGASGGILISIAVAINAFGNISTQILCKARTWHAMSRDGLFFNYFKSLDSKYKSPNNALIGQGIWASALLIIAIISSYFSTNNNGTNLYETVIDFFTATSIIFNLLTFGSIFILRKKFPTKKRPYKALFYPWSMIIVILFYLVFLMITIYTAFIPSLMGIGLTLSGTIYYYLKILK